jgi:hypothetical protein
MQITKQHMTKPLSYLQRSFAVLVAGLTMAFTASAYQAPKADEAPRIDGVGDEPTWQAAKWHAIDQFIMGEPTDTSDFSGRFKMVWTPSKLYLLAEISDDVLLDRHPNPLKNYWQDDLLEVFLDEDASGGDHHKSYNAFAYHVSLDNQVVDIGQDGQPRMLNEHVRSVWRRDSSDNNRLVWELGIQIHDDSYTDSSSTQRSVELTAGKKLGFMVAYCDADDLQNGRENFITSHDIEAINGDKNRAYLDASVFAELTLVDN